VRWERCFPNYGFGDLGEEQACYLQGKQLKTTSLTSKVWGWKVLKEGCEGTVSTSGWTLVCETDVKGVR